MNELLLWMSARHSGSAEAFRSKVAALGLVGGRSPQPLGHAEFAPRRGRWLACTSSPRYW
jgi:hypothetical protein